MKDKKKVIIIFCILIFIIVLSSMYFLFLKKPNNVNNNDNQVEITKIKGLREEDTTNYTNKLIIYYDKEEYEFCYYDDISKCSNKKILIKTESDNANKYNEIGDKYVFYKDKDKIKVYNNYTKKSYIINLDTKYFSYEFNVDSLTNEFIGVTYYEDENSNASFYSVIEDEVIYDKAYKGISFVSEEYLNGSEYECSNNNCRQTKVNLLSTKENKVLLSYTFKKKASGYYEENLYYQLLRNEKQTYICLSTFIDATIYEEIYNDEFKKLQEDIGEFSASVSSEGYLYVEKNGIVTAYNKNGEIIKKSEKYDVLQIIDDYIVTIKNNKLVLITIDGEVTEIAPWNKNKNVYMVYYSKSIIQKGKYKILLGVLDSDVKVDEVWNTCLQTGNCYATSKDEIENYYELGYFYYFTKDTKQITKVPAYM